MNQDATPTGLDVRPAKPKAERLSRRAAMAALLLIGFLFALIIYGVVTRKPVSDQVGGDGNERKATAASLAAREIAGQVPEGNAGLLAPKPAPSEGRDPLQAEPQQPQPQQQPQAVGVQVEGLSPEEQLREEAYALQREAMRSTTPALARGGGGSIASMGGGGGVPQMPQLPQLPALPGAGGLAPHQMAMLEQAGQAAAGQQGQGAAFMPAGIPGLGVGGDGGYDAQNRQGAKAAFLRQDNAADNYLKHSRQAALSPFEVKAGWDMPAVMEQGINSDLPGDLRAVIRENVYDTATGKHLLIPQGTKALGVYSSNIGFGQDGLQVVWNRLIFPDGSSINLGPMVGQDAAGLAGFRDQVNNHWGRVIGGAILTSLFSAGFQLSQGNNRSGTILDNQSSGQIVAAAAGAEVSRVGSEVTRRNLNIQPTIEIRPGYRFNIRVNKDMLFPAPYRPVGPAR